MSAQPQHRYEPDPRMVERLRQAVEAADRARMERVTLRHRLIRASRCIWPRH